MAQSVDADRPVNTVDDLRDPEIDISNRLDSEWLVLNAIRELRRLSSHGADSTYDKALEYGAELLPALLGPDVSLIRKARESDVVKEYKQRAIAESNWGAGTVTAIELFKKDIKYHERLLDADHTAKMDQVRRRLKILKEGLREVQPEAHSEHQYIFRDVYKVKRKLPDMPLMSNSRDYWLPDGNGIRIRVCHPDRPEHLTGADLIYERHDPIREFANIVLVQYKIWDAKTKSLVIDEKIQKQIRRMKSVTCDSSLCKLCETTSAPHYRFPFCSAFIRPTDKLQSADQKLITTGEHLPICMISQCSIPTRGGASDKITYEDIRHTSLSHQIFEGLFSHNKIGSRSISYSELTALYEKFEVEADEDKVVFHVQDVPAIPEAAARSMGYTP